MKSKILYLILLIIISLPKDVFPFDGLLFKPPTASIFEPRLGCLYQIQDDKLRLDIGTSLDLFELQKSDNSETRFGTDFFTYTRLRSKGRFKFPVETSDYFFGINFTNQYKFKDFTIGSRLRISHISSHLVDGLSNEGAFREEAFVYSREFIDILFALEDYGIRPYLGISYIFSTIPDDVNKIIPQFGMDFSYPLIEDFLNLKTGYDLKLGGYNEIFTPIHCLQIGIALLTLNNKGISLNFNCYRGKSMHGMFYDKNDNYISIGFQIEQ
jgi:hypothetical protein